MVGGYNDDTPLLCRKYDFGTLPRYKAFQIEVQYVLLNCTSIYLILSNSVYFSSIFRTTHWWHEWKQHKKWSDGFLILLRSVMLYTII